MDVSFTSGGSGAATVTWTNEALVGAVNDVNTLYSATSAAVDNDTFNLFVDGILQYPFIDYTRAATVITMLTAPSVGQTLWCTYRDS